MTLARLVLKVKLVDLKSRSYRTCFDFTVIIYLTLKSRSKVELRSKVKVKYVVHRGLVVFF